jgi:hypothetical protein
VVVDIKREVCVGEGGGGEGQKEKRGSLTYRWAVHATRQSNWGRREANTGRGRRPRAARRRGRVQARPGQRRRASLHNGCCDSRCGGSCLGGTCSSSWSYHWARGLRGLLAVVCACLSSGGGRGCGRLEGGRFLEAVELRKVDGLWLRLQMHRAQMQIQTARRWMQNDAGMCCEHSSESSHTTHHTCTCTCTCCRHRDRGRSTPHSRGTHTQGGNMGTQACHKKNTASATSSGEGCGGGGGAAAAAKAMR